MMAAVRKGSASVHCDSSLDVMARCGLTTSRWLTKAENREMQSWRDAARRTSWLAARWLAKRALIDECALPVRLEQIEILSRDRAGRSVRPRVRVDGQAWQGSLSISHSRDQVLVVVAQQEKLRVGCDLQGYEAVSPGFADLWFTDAERCTFPVPSTAERMLELWAAKEAYYKAFHHGEAFRPRQWQINWDDGRYECYYGKIRMPGWCELTWRNCGQHKFVIAVCAAECSDEFP